MSSKTVTINFATAKAADHFATWLCEAGEQDYWQWMEMREGEEQGPITATSFSYDFGTLTIETVCGRMDAP